MPIGSTVVYNPGDLILHNVSSSGNTFQEVKIAAATSSIILFNSNGLISSQSLNSTTVGTSSYVSGSNIIVSNLTASNISASGFVSASGVTAINGVTGGTTGGRNAVVATNDGSKLQTSYTLYQPGNATDQKYWELISLNSGSTLSLRTVNDTYSLAADILKVNRSTSYLIDSIVFPNGNITASGTISASGAVIASSFTGSFNGSISNATSASYANSASYAGTASWASNALTASYVSSSNIVGTVTSASYALSSSYTTLANTATTANALNTSNNYTVTNLTSTGTANFATASFTGDVTIPHFTYGSNTGIWYQIDELVQGDQYLGESERMIVNVYGGYFDQGGMTQYVISTRNILSVYKSDINGGVIGHTLKLYKTGSSAASASTDCYLVGIRITSGSYYSIQGTAYETQHGKYCKWTNTVETGSGVWTDTNFTSSTFYNNSTSSWSTNALTASYVSSSNIVGTVTSASYAVSASLAATAGALVTTNNYTVANLTSTGTSSLGYVGIGTSLLQDVVTIGSGVSGSLLIQSDSNNTLSNAKQITTQLGFLNQSSANLHFARWRGVNATDHATVGQVDNAGSYDLQFSAGRQDTGSAVNYFTSSAVRMTIKSVTGNVGIGTTNPNTLLNVGSGTPSTAASGIQFGSDTSANLYRLATGAIKTDGGLTVVGAMFVQGTTNCAAITVSSISSSGAIIASSFTGSFSGSINSSVSASYANTASYLTIGNNYTITNLTANNISASGTISSSTAYFSNIGFFDNTVASDTSTFPTGSTSSGLILDGGVYTNGFYRTRFVKVDRSGNLSLYIQETKGNSGSFSNLARFGTHANSSNTFEVFGTTNIQGSITSSNFVGPLIGNTTGTASWATNALTAALATSINFTASNAITSQTASYLTPANSYTVANLTASNISASTITASNMIVNGNLTVTGSIFASLFSASNIYITSSTLVVTDNIITINALSPYQRYAGLAMYDSGSGTLSSFLWDSVNNYFFVSSSDAGASRQIILGPTGEASLTANYIPLISGSNNLTSSVIYQSGSNIGIGTPSPNGKLHVVSPDSTYAFSVAGATKGVRFNINSNGTYIQGVDNTLASSYQSLTLGGSDLYFQTNGVTNAMYISSSGNIGIGTTTPLSKFVVNGGTVNTSSYTTSEARIADGTLHLMKTVAGGVFESIRAMNMDTTAGTTVRVLAASTSDPFNNANGGKVFIDAIRTSTNMDLAFSLNDVAAAAAVERVRFMGSGNVGIGSTSPVNKLDVVGNISCSAITASNFTGGTFTPTNIISSGTIIYKNAVLLDYSSSALATSQSNYVVLQNLTGSYNSAFFDYFASSASNFRAGTVIAGWSGNNITYTEYATTDVGTTNQLTMSAAISASYIQLLGNAASSLNWNIKSSGRYL